MKDKNQLIGWILIAIVLFGWTWYSQKDAAQRHAEQVVRDSIENVRMIEQAKIEKEKAKKENAEKMAELADTLNPLHAARQIKETTTVIKNDLLALTVSSNGAQLKKAEILNPDYKNQEGGNVVLFDGDDNSFVISIDGKSTNILTSDFEFEPKDVTESSVTMSLPIAGGSLDIVYELIPESYFVNMTVKANNLDGFFPSNTKSMNILWKEAMKQQEKG
ncbi:MAG: YidC/Oxa1 family insertase periplasmic-domain containing protein, partial [Bacteroidaceae bacterium]|nr:YidC/Oxa1 family insertase periplasmic-domain containing protein [Bacteroidaceae bacterium]